MKDSKQTAIYQLFQTAVYTICSSLLGFLIVELLIRRIGCNEENLRTLVYNTIGCWGILFLYYYLIGGYASDRLFKVLHTKYTGADTELLTALSQAPILAPVSGIGLGFLWGTDRIHSFGSLIMQSLGFLLIAFLTSVPILYKMVNPLSKALLKSTVRLYGKLCRSKEK